MLSDLEITKMFSRMAHLWGHKWVSVYGEAAMDDRGRLTPAAMQWRYDLRDYTRGQVAFGIEQAIEQRMGWPPGPIELMNLCEGVPTVAQVLDRDRDYGPICKAIRSRMDWYNLDGMSSAKRRSIGAQQYETALVGLRREGAIQRMAIDLASEHRQREALT